MLKIRISAKMSIKVQDMQFVKKNIPDPPDFISPLSPMAITLSHPADNPKMIFLNVCTGLTLLI
jgi:hypothetical protein